MTRKPTLKRRAQQTVAKVTRTADNADVVASLREQIATLNRMAQTARVAIEAAGMNDRALAIDEVLRVESFRKGQDRARHTLVTEGWQRVGIIPISRRLADGYDYRYMPIMRSDSTADENNAEVWRKAVGE